MTKFLRHTGLTVAATLTVAGCASGPTNLAPPSGAAASVRSAITKGGDVTVPISIPGLNGRGVQYIYNKNYINTVEVTLTDSLGNPQTQWVARNTYLAGSSAAGTAAVTFHDVMPGTFTLTVRTSHVALLGTNDSIIYDGQVGAFYSGGNHANGGTLLNVLSGDKTTAFVVFDDAYNASNGEPYATAIFDPVISDTTTTLAGFGVGAATASVVTGQTTSVAVSVGQLPHWDPSTDSTSLDVTAGAAVSMPVADVADVQATDQVMMGAVLDHGLFTLGAGTSQYDVATTSSAVTFVPTVSTFGNATDVYLSRGQAASAWAENTWPTVTVWPALATNSTSVINASQNALTASGQATIGLDLRDSFNNFVYGNGLNGNNAGNPHRANAYLSEDYNVVGYEYGPDATGGYPFIVPGKTSGTFAGNTYFQGSVPATLTGASASVSTFLASNTATDSVQLTQMEIPYFLYNYAQAHALAAFATGAYTLSVIPNPAPGSTYLWVSLAGPNGVTIASSSIDPTSASRTVSLGLTTAELGAAVQPANTIPVVLTLGNGVTLGSPYNNLYFTVNSFGARKIGDTDTVEVRVLNNNQALWTKNLAFSWTD